MRRGTSARGRVRPSVAPFVGPSVRRSVGPALYSRTKISNFICYAFSIVEKRMCPYVRQLKMKKSESVTDVKFLFFFLFFCIFQRFT